MAGFYGIGHGAGGLLDGVSGLDRTTGRACGACCGLERAGLNGASRGGLAGFKGWASDALQGGLDWLAYWRACHRGRVDR